ncbi:MAG: hypothetical protein V8Q75_06455 [Bacilli bacterium]
MKELQKQLTRTEKELLIKLKFDNIEDLLDLEDELGDYIQLHCIDDTGNELTEDGIICEEILNKIGNIN